MTVLLPHRRARRAIARQELADDPRPRSGRRRSSKRRIGLWARGGSQGPPRSTEVPTITKKIGTKKWPSEVIPPSIVLDCVGDRPDQQPGGEGCLDDHRRSAPLRQPGHPERDRSAPRTVAVPGNSIRRASRNSERDDEPTGGQGDHQENPKALAVVSEHRRHRALLHPESAHQRSSGTAGRGCRRSPRPRLDDPALRLAETAQVGEDPAP